MFAEDIQEDIKATNEVIVKDERYMRAYESFKRPPYYLEWSKEWQGIKNLSGECKE